MSVAQSAHPAAFSVPFLSVPAAPSYMCKRHNGHSLDITVIGGSSPRADDR